MANRAAAELADLRKSTGSTVDQAGKLAATEAKKSEDIANENLIDRAREGAEGIASPEAIATGVAAGWILGPIGGIALGVAQGILGKRERQNALDRFAEEQETISGVSDVIGDELNRMEATARNADDLNQVSNMKTQKAAAIEFMTSASPRLQEQGAQMLNALQTEMTEYADRQETQRVADEQLDAQLRRELEQEQYDRFNGMKLRFDNESAQFEEVVGATNIAMAALRDGTPAQLHAATVLINKALDPTGVVRPEEAKALGGLGSILDKAEVYVEALRNGKTLLPEQRRDFQGLLKQLQDGAFEIQLARETRFQTELADAEVPIKFWDNFNMTDRVPIEEPGGIEDDALLDPARGAATDLIEQAVETGRMVPGAIEKAGEAIEQFGEDAAKTWLDIFVPDSVMDDRPVPRSQRPTN